MYICDGNANSHTHTQANIVSMVYILYIEIVVSVQLIMSTDNPKKPHSLPPTRHMIIKNSVTVHNLGIFAVRIV